MTNLLGTRLAGKYEIQVEIGRGGMGVVYRGYDLMLKRTVAIKVLPREFTYGQQFVQRFRQEAIMAASLHQPNIVTIYDVGEQEGVHYIVMQFLDGVTLDQWLVAHGPMPLPQANHIVRQMADALDYAHSRGIVHRDIKPSNIMVGPSGHITLMDFGLVRAGEGTGLTRTGMIVGTPDYMAPEQALGHPVDARTDIYSFGVVLYRMLSGQVPFARSTSIAIAYAHVNDPPPLLRELRPDVPKSVEAVVFKTLAKRPEDRYQQAGQLAAQFAQAVGGKMPAGLKTVATPSPGTAGVATKTGAGVRRASPSSPRPSPTPASNPAMAADAPTQLASQYTPSPPLVSAAQTPPTRRPSRFMLVGAAVLLVSLTAGAVLALGNNSPSTPAATVVASVTAAQDRRVLLPTAVLADITPTRTVTPLAATATPTASAVETPTPTETPSVLPTHSPTAIPLLIDSPTATITSTPTATATRATTSTPTPTTRPDNTSTPTPTTRPDNTSTPTPTTRPSNTSTPTPTARPTNTSTATPTVVSGAPVLVAPAENTTVSGVTTFSWQWSGPALAPNQAFEVRLWKEGQSDHYGAAEPVRTTSATLDVAAAYGVQQGGSGRYFWSVAVVQTAPDYQRVGQEAPARILLINIGGGDPGPTRPAPPPGPTRQSG